MLKNIKQWQKGFAAIELIIVVAVVAAIVSVGFYSFSKLKAASDTVHPSISGISPQPAKLGQKVTVKKGSTAFKPGKYIIYYHGKGDATHKILITEMQNGDSTGATLTFTMPTNNKALNAVLKTSGNTTGGMQVKDSSSLYSNSYAFTIGALPAASPSPTPSSTSVQSAEVTVTPAKLSDTPGASLPSTDTSTISAQSSDVLSTSTPSSTQKTTYSNKVFMLGGSIFARLLAGSDIKQRLKTNGWDLSYDAVGGRTLEEGLSVAKSKPNIVKNSNVIIVALGINNNKNPDSEFTAKLNALYKYLKSQNSTAKIYWLNYAIYYMGPAGDPAETARVASVKHKNTVLEAYAKANNVRIIDWAKESTRSDYGSPTGDDVHPSTDGRAHLSRFISQKITAPVNTATTVSTAVTSNPLICRVTFSLLGCVKPEPVGTPNAPQIVSLLPTQGPAGSKVKVWGNSTFMGTYKVKVSTNSTDYETIASVGTSNGGQSITFVWPKTISNRGNYKVTVTDELGRTSNRADFKVVKCSLANRWLCK